MKIQIKKLPQVIIVMRHGQSDSNKDNPERILTDLGAKQVLSSSRRLRNLIDPKDFVIVSTPTSRTNQSAAITAEQLNINETFVLSYEAYFVDWKFVRNLRLDSDRSLSETYFRVSNQKKYKSLVAPKELVNRQLREIIKLGIDKNVILITHAGVGDAYKFCKLYKPQSNLDWDNEFSEAEFRFLNRKH